MILVPISEASLIGLQNEPALFVQLSIVLCFGRCVKPFACLLLRFPVESAPVSHSLYLDKETERPESHLIIFFSRCT